MAELSGSGLDSRTRLQSSSGLCPSEGSTGAGGSTSRLTHVAGDRRFQILAEWTPHSAAHNVQPASPRVGDWREGDTGMEAAAGFRT